MTAVQILIPALIGLWAIVYGFIIGSYRPGRISDGFIGGIISGLGAWLVLLGIITALN